MYTEKFLVRRVAVLGAGVMGAQIAAHLVNADVDVVLFDLPAKDGPKNGIVERAIAGLKKLSPAPLGHPDLAGRIVAANYEDDLEQLRGCDLVIEAIAERLEWKLDLYAKVAPAVADHAIFATNTSGLSINRLAEGLPDGLRARFCGVHFFNPPRYMHLVELIAARATASGVVDRLEAFLTTTLGKGCIRAKDTPNFIANRIGIFGVIAAVLEAQRAGLSADIVDDLTGSKLGRAKSGTFRTIDIVGLDTVGHVLKTMQDQLGGDPFHALYGTPGVLATLIGRGALGQKSGAGFYRREGGKIQRFDEASGDYVASGAKADETVVRILKKKTWSERIGLLRASKNPQAQFVWALLRDGFQYAAATLGEIADTAREVDLAMRFGFGMREGPFEIWQQAGWAQVADWVREDIDAGRALAPVPLPDWVFSGPVAERGGVHQAEGSWSPQRGAFVARARQPFHARQLFPVALYGEGAADPHAAGTTVFENDAIRLWALDAAPDARQREVLIASIRSKMHAIGPDVIDGLTRGVELAERRYRGLVVWSPDDPFSVGADLQAMLPVFMTGGAKAVEPLERRLQQTMLRLRYAQVPTVAAVAGMALGGGCELALYCARRVAHLESYVGLVEVGVGLVPGAGGLTYGARRAAEEQQAAPDAYLLHFLKKYFSAAAMAEVSKSALEARATGWLQDADVVVFHRDELLYVALNEAIAMSEAAWRAPPRARFAVGGRPVRATFEAQLVNLRDGGFASEHDVHLAGLIADAMCGGDVDEGTVVDEEWIMCLERRAFLALLDHPKTQQRVMGMLQTGKPVRN